MKKLLTVALSLVCATAQAQFTPGQLLTAQALNSQFALKTTNASAAITGGTISGLSSPLPIASGGTGSSTSTGTGSVVLSTSPSITGTFGLTGAVTSAITSGGALNQTLSKSGPTGQSIYTGICGGCTSFDGLQSTLTIPSGTTVTTSTGIGSYINNQNGTGTPTSGNGVNFFSVQTCAVNNANCWSLNNVLIDNTTYATSSVTGVKLIAYEQDFDVTSPNTIVQGPNLLGSSLVQPSSAVGFSVGSLSTQSPGLAKWTLAFSTANGAATTAANWGALSTSGSNIASQPVLQTYFDGSGTVRAWTTQVLTNGNLTLTDGGNGHQFQTNSGLISKVLSGAGSVTVDNAGSQQSLLLLNDNGANKWQVGKLANNNFFLYDNAASAFVMQMPSAGTLTISPVTAFSAGVQLPVTTVAALPSCGAGQKGLVYAVSDATAPTYNGVLTGGGAVSVPVYCNGSAWTSH